MKVMFDSNVWEIVATPAKWKNELSQKDFKKIHKSIFRNKIEAYLSETIFTIEAIKKIERQDFFASVKPKITTITKSNEKLVSSIISISPHEKDAINFENRPILKKHFDNAMKLGFKIANLPRLGMPVNPEIKSKRLNISEDKLLIIYEVEEKISNKGAGIKKIIDIGNRYDSNFFKGLKQSPESDRTKIAKATAEWADGDSVAISIGLNCDYFCTRDQAKNAGNNSVLSSNNLLWLKQKYGFKVISPEELAKKI